MAHSGEFDLAQALGPLAQRINELAEAPPLPESRLTKILSSPQTVRIIGIIAAAAPGLALFSIGEHGMGATLATIGATTVYGSIEQSRRESAAQQSEAQVAQLTALNAIAEHVQSR